MSTITADSATDIAVRVLRDERAIHLREAHRIGTLLRLIGDEVAPPERPSVRQRVRDLLRADTDRTWSVSELMAELQAIEPLPGTNPERAVRSALRDMWAEGLIVRAQRGRYQAHEREAVVM